MTEQTPPPVPESTKAPAKQPPKGGIPIPRFKTGKNSKPGNQKPAKPLGVNALAFLAQVTEKNKNNDFKPGEFTLGRCKVVVENDNGWKLIISGKGFAPSFKELREARRLFIPDGAFMGYMFGPIATEDSDPFRHILFEVTLSDEEKESGPKPEAPAPVKPEKKKAPAKAKAEKPPVTPQTERKRAKTGKP